MKTVLLIIIFAFSFGNCSINTRSRVLIDSVRLAIKAESPNKKMELEPDTLYASIGETKFQITTSGLLSWGDNPADSIHLNTDAATEKVYLDTISKKYLIVFYEENWATDGASSIEKIDMKSKKSLWQVHVAGFNLGQPYIKQEFAYVTAIGTVLKLNLLTGKTAFEFKDLYDREKDSFNNFDSVSFRKDLVYFFSKNITSKGVDTIIVDERSNKITIKN